MSSANAPTTLTAPDRPVPDGPPAASRWTGGRIAAVVMGCILILTSFGLLTAGGVALWADRSLREGGYVTTGQERFFTGTYALTTDNLRVDVGGARVAGSMLGTMRVRVSPALPSSEVFVGIARTSDARAYLDDVAHAVVGDFPDRTTMHTIRGAQAPADPRVQTFWLGSSYGAGTQTLVWKIRSGDWTLVAMNADGRAGVDVTGDVGATLPALRWIAPALVTSGLVFIVLGFVLVIVPLVRSRERARAS